MDETEGDGVTADTGAGVVASEETEGDGVTADTGAVIVAYLRRLKEMVAQQQERNVPILSDFVHFHATFSFLIQHVSLHQITFS